MERHTVQGTRSASAVLGETNHMDLADDFYFLAHDNVSGAPRLHDRAVATGLAGGLLAELLLSGWATVEEGVLTAVDCRPKAPADLDERHERSEEPTLVRAVWGNVVREPWRYPLRTWLTVLGADAVPRVVERLAGSGYLKVNRSRRAGGGHAEPTDWNVAGWPVARLRGLLQRGQQFSWQDVVLLALVDATGLHHFVLADLSEPARDYHTGLLRNLMESYPKFAELAAHTEAAVAASVLVRGHSR
jgi:hypothetical protein